MEVYNKQQTENGTGTPKEKPDVKDLIPQMKKKVLDDIHIVFSGLIPQQQTLSDSTYWRLAESFGAVCLPDLTGNVTHVIAAKVNFFFPFFRILRSALMTNKDSVNSTSFFLFQMTYYCLQILYRLEPIR